MHASTRTRTCKETRTAIHPIHAGVAGRGALPVAVEKDPAGHGEQSASDDRVAPAPRPRPAPRVLRRLLSYSRSMRRPAVIRVIGCASGRLWARGRRVLV